MATITLDISEIKIFPKPHHLEYNDKHGKRRIFDYNHHFRVLIDWDSDKEISASVHFNFPGPKGYQIRFLSMKQFKVFMPFLTCTHREGFYNYYFLK